MSWITSWSRYPAILVQGLPVFPRDRPEPK